MYPLLVPFNGKLASRCYGVYNQIIVTFALETIHTDTLKKIRGSAVQENAIFVFISYNQQAKNEETLKLVAVSKNGKLYFTRKDPGRSFTA